jgi:hypothetical protein
LDIKAIILCIEMIGAEVSERTWKSEQFFTLS